ncbi:hypothetical protein IL306_010904 [Fusarium sp. DS 682]|nr:hypothetical protein IL306_010904 [Fusarium sp. DS 682]
MSYNIRVLALELGRNTYVRSCKYRAAGVILYNEENEFQHHTELDKKYYPWLTVLDKSAIWPDFAKSEVNWERLQQWYTDLPGRDSEDKSGLMNESLPNGFCLINVPEARLVETDGVQVPKYAALSYV